MQLTPRFNVALMRDDMTAKGWLPADLADRAAVARSTVGRFFAGAHQTSRVAKKLAKALGQKLERYVIRSSEAA